MQKERASYRRLWIRSRNAYRALQSLLGAFREQMTEILMMAQRFKQQNQEKEKQQRVEREKQRQMRSRGMGGMER